VPFSLISFGQQIFDNLEIFQSWFGFSNIGGAAGTTSSEILEEETNKKVVSKLHEILRPFLLRRLKKDVLVNMPPKKEVVVYTPMSLLQRDYYSLAYEGKLREKLLEMGLSGGRDCSQININMNLRKIANHPFLFGEPNDETGQPICDARPELLVTASGKFKVLDSMLRHLHRGNHQVLIFSQMTETLNIMEDYLRFRQWRYCRIDGNVKIQERQSQMDAFNTDKGIFVFMLSTRAGGLGINLQAADTVILFDSDWNPHQDAQVGTNTSERGGALGHIRARESLRTRRRIFSPLAAAFRSLH
jgi:ATP-dependent DNA helicase